MDGPDKENISSPRLESELQKESDIQALGASTNNLGENIEQTLMKRLKLDYNV